MVICEWCSKVDERLYCPECSTFTATACVNCGFCTECTKIYKALDFHDYKGRE